MEPDQGRQAGGLDEEPETGDAVALIERIKPLLANQDETVIGAALAQLVAMYVVGHIDENPYKTKKFRKAVMDMHLAMVRQLIPLNEQWAMEEGALDEGKGRPN